MTLIGHLPCSLHFWGCCELPWACAAKAWLAAQEAQRNGPSRYRGLNSQKAPGRSPSTCLSQCLVASSLLASILTRPSALCHQLLLTQAIGLDVLLGNLNVKLTSESLKQTDILPAKTYPDKVPLWSARACTQLGNLASTLCQPRPVLSFQLQSWPF